MKILVSSINFAPDHSGIALYSTDLPVYIAEQGHAVTMVTGFPYYPNWRKRPEDQGRLFSTETYKDVRVLRGYLYVPRAVNTLRRIVHELSFNLFAALNFLRAGRQECIVILSPPLLLGLVGVLFAWWWKAQLVFHIQDLQPDAALSLGMVKKGLLIRILLRIEALIYRRSTWVATITRGMWERLVAKGVPQEKLGIYYNWIDVEATARPRPAGRFRSQHPGFQDKFLVAYAGNIGIKQGVDVMVDLAAALADDPGVHFLIIGDGADKPRLMAVAWSRGLRNLTFLPFLGPEPYLDMLQDIDVSFVAQKSGTGNVFFPSKLLGIMAMSKPLLVSADPDSELACVVRESDSGRVAAAGDIPALARAVRDWNTDRASLARIGSNGLQTVRQFDRKVVLQMFLDRILATRR
jgi:colanic acid biosynthesis glycosyl transferase WcaI